MVHIWVTLLPLLVALVLTASLRPSLVAQGSENRTVSALAAEPSVKAALDSVRVSEPQTIEMQIRLTEIPAPPFKETARGEEMRQLFKQAGLQKVRVDKAGNVLGERPGLSLHPHVVVAAHLDTVFPEGTNVKVRRNGSILYAPGIGDDSRGLAVLVAMAQAMNDARVSMPGTVTFVADVGEEGLGDLRGMRMLFDETLKGTVDRFVTIDGTGMSISHTFVGSRRYRATFKGPGGHSFTDFGLPNPIGALGRAIAKIGEIQTSGDSQTTFNVGRVGGGTSVNAIPAEAWMEIDARSADRTALGVLDGQIHAIINQALASEQARWQTSGVLTVTTDVVGDRPAGLTPVDSLIVQSALAATRAVGAVPFAAISSSDANYPTSLRIPAVQIGGGGHGADAHALTESFDTTDSWRGTARALLLVISLAQQ